MQKRGAWLLVVALLAWGAYLAGSQDTPPPGSAADEEPPDVAAAPPNRVPVPETPRAAPRPNVAPEADPQSNVVDEPTSDEAPSPEFLHWHLGFERQPRNEQWALKREAIITDALQRMDVVGGRFESVECKRSICRVRLAFDSPDTQAQNGRLFQELTRILGPNTRYELQDQPDGGREVMVWARPGR